MFVELISNLTANSNILLTAKRQRTIQVMELGDLPKQRPGRVSQAKPSNHSRHRANVRR